MCHPFYLKDSSHLWMIYINSKSPWNIQSTSCFYGDLWQRITILNTADVVHWDQSMTISYISLFASLLEIALWKAGEASQIRREFTLVDQRSDLLRIYPFEVTGCMANRLKFRCQLSIASFLFVMCLGYFNNSQLFVALNFWILRIQPAFLKKNTMSTQIVMLLDF